MTDPGFEDFLEQHKELVPDEDEQHQQELMELAFQLKQAAQEGDSATIAKAFGLTQNGQDTLDQMVEWLNAPVPSPMSDEAAELEWQPLVPLLDQLRQEAKIAMQHIPLQKRKDWQIVLQVILDEMCNGWGMCLDQLFLEEQ